MLLSGKIDRFFSLFVHMIVAALIVCINVTSMDLNYPQLNLIQSFARRP